MGPPLLLLLLLLLASIPSLQSALVLNHRGYYLNCGSSTEETIGSIRWTPDEGFVSGGNVSFIDVPGIMPLLSTLRHFPDKSARKHCFTFQVAKGARYLVRTTYYYGSYDGGSEPPLFDQIIDGTKWSTVNTSANYARGLTSYYEIIVAPQGKKLSVCLARNELTTSDPFISGLEVESLEDSMYNSTDFTKYALATVARHRFGHTNQLLGYPDDPFNRYWGPFTDHNPVVESHSNVSSSNFWNLLPEKALEKAVTTSRGKPLVVHWPEMELPSGSYYVALYFQDNRTPSPYSWRVFDVAVNGNKFYTGLNVTAAGVMVYGTNWPLSGATQIVLTPVPESPVGPLINAGEILQVVPLGGRTVTRDVIAMNEIARSFKNPPSDWNGDPCLPWQNSWTGVTCSHGDLARVVSLNLSNVGLAGTLSESIGKLTAATSIWLNGNKLSGHIPDMGSLRELTSLRLQDNELTGPIPSSLGDLQKLKELDLQHNKLNGPVPEELKKRTGIDVLTGGNQIM